MINRIILIGRLGADPELRYTQQGTPVIKFDIAVNRPYKDANGIRESDWFPIVAWRQLAELCAQYMKKGSQIAIEGRLQTRSYDNKEGQRIKVYEVVAENVQFLDRIENGQANIQNKQSSKSNTSRSEYKDPFANNDKIIDLSDEDLPF